MHSNAMFCYSVADAIVIEGTAFSWMHASPCLDNLTFRAIKNVHFIGMEEC